MTKKISIQPSNKYLSFLKKFWDKRRSVQDKIDELSMKIHEIEQDNVERVRGSALSRRQHKRIEQTELVSRYDTMVKQGNKR